MLFRGKYQVQTDFEVDFPDAAKRVCTAAATQCGLSLHSTIDDHGNIVTWDHHAQRRRVLEYHPDAEILADRDVIEKFYALVQKLVAKKLAKEIP